MTKFCLDKFSCYFKIVILGIAVFFLYSCSPSRHISKNGYLLSNNKITINNKTISKGSVTSYIQQDPNHRFLGVKAGMYIYSASRPIEDSVCNFFEKYILRTIGDKPVEISDDLREYSCENIKTYLHMHGCFGAKVKSSLSPVRRWYAPWSYYKKRRNVNYEIDVSERAVVDTFFVTTEDPQLYNVVSDLTDVTRIKKGSWYDEDILSEIRQDVASGMLDKGYYAFSAKYIVFDVDTNEGINHTKISMTVKNPSVLQGDSVNENRHKPYKISKIYIYPDYIPTTSADYRPPIDTTLYFHKQQKGYALTPLYFINNTTTPTIKERTLMRSILMQNNNLFSPEISENTYSSLFQLRNFKYIDISYEDITKKIQDTNDLACYIKLSQAKPVSLSTAFEINYSANNDPINNQSSSNFGMESSLSYSDKNLLHGAEVFTTNLKLAAEINSNIFKSDNQAVGWELFNAFEAGIDFGIELPRFLAPYSTAFYSMRFRPHTSIRAGYNIQKRYYYERSIFNLNYGYSWNTSDKKFFAFIPLEVNYVNMDITDSKYARLISTMDKRIQYQMSNHLVMAMRFSYIYNGQPIEQKKDFNYFSMSLESAGNLLDVYSMIFDQSKDDVGHYNIFKIPFSQYLRADFTFIRYNYLNHNTSFVYKIFGGVGCAYGNAEAMPYEKSFFGGGANNLRAWQLRSLGPGSSKSSEQMKYDRAGDLALGINLEYRFPIMGPLEGATFFDMGNIWTLRSDKGMTGAKFSKDFYKEIASGVGFGLRLNIKVFIVRFDFAAKVWDPSKEMKDRFVLDNIRLRDVAVQFGIGYPF